MSVTEDGSLQPLPASVEAALSRLSGAVARLQAAAERRAAGRPGHVDEADELALLQQDRARLADDLDAALARLARLGSAHSEVQARLDRAEGAVRQAMMRLGPGAETCADTGAGGA